MPKRSVYLDVAARAVVRGRAKSDTVIGRGGEAKRLRCYHLTSDKLAKLRRKISDEGRFCSPYSPKRIHSFIVNSFVACGTNEYHMLHEVFAVFSRLMMDASTVRDGASAWDRYESKTPKNIATTLPPLPRFIKTLEFLQRLGGNHPVGLKLAQLGACIDIAKRDDGMLMVRLRTDIPLGEPVQPINQNRVRTYTKTVTSVPSGFVTNE